MAASFRGKSEGQSWHSGKLKGKTFSFFPWRNYYLAILDLSHPLKYQYLSLWHYRGLRTSCSYLMYMFSKLLYSYLGSKHKIFCNSTLSCKYLSAFSSFSGTWHLSNSVEEMSFPVTTESQMPNVHISFRRRHPGLHTWYLSRRVLASVLVWMSVQLIPPAPYPRLHSAGKH